MKGNFMTKKREIYIKLIIDSREQNNDWLKAFKFDKKMKKDKVQFLTHEKVEPFKCLDSDGKKVKTSTGDVGIQYSFDMKTWFDTNLSIELKKDEDFSSTLYSSWKRFSAEIERSKAYGLDFYVVYSQTTRQMHQQFTKLKYMNKISYAQQPEKVVYHRMIDLVDNNVKLLHSHEIHEIVKRIVKHYIKKNKLQYSLDK